MKKIRYFLIAAATLIGVAGCGKFIDGYNVNPNSPVDVTLPLILPATELGLQTVYTTGLCRVTSVYIQQIAGTKEQMVQVADYNNGEGDNTNDWNTLYSNVVQPCNDMIQRAGTENPYYKGIAEVMKAMALGLATDEWGDVPATEAGQGNDGNLTPKFDAQADVLVYIGQLLDDAITQFGMSEADNTYLPSTDDYMFNGDVAKWKNIALIVKARYENRLSLKEPIQSATDVLATLSSVTDLGNMQAIYNTGSSELNQWYAFDNARADYIKTGKFMVDYLVATNDPRLPFYVALNPDNNYVGSPADSQDLNASNIGPFISSPAAPINIVTYAEVLFMRAEAYMRLSQPDNAAIAYNDAVKAAVKMVTGSDAPASFITAYASEDNSTITMEKIMTQKYLALYINVEAYADWRRTGYPVLTPNPNGAIPSIPVRFATVLDERLYNPNAIVVSDLTKPVWWDTATK